MAQILAIAVTFNAMPWVDKCLGSLEKSPAAPDILIVDNGSLDGTPEYIAENWPQATVVDNGENAGFGEAANTGLKYALAHGYDFVFLLRQDSWLERDTLEKMVAAWKPAYGILSPVQMNAKGRRMDRAFARKCKRYLKKEYADPAVATVPSVTAGHWLISRKALETVGGFSPAFVDFGKEENWTDRLHYFGYKAGIVKDAKALCDRPERKMTEEEKMNQKCLKAVIKISNPSHSFFGRHIVEPLDLIGMTLWHFSTVPVRYIPTFLKRYGELKALRTESKSPGAFL